MIAVRRIISLIVATAIGCLGAASLAAAFASSAVADPVSSDISGAVRVDLRWTMSTGGTENYGRPIAFNVADTRGGRIAVICARQDGQVINSAAPGEVPCQAQAAQTGGIANAHWAGTGYPPHLAFVDDDPASTRAFCLSATTYTSAVNGTATFTDPAGAQRPVAFSASESDFMLALIGTTPAGDPRWQPNCFYDSGGIGPAPRDYVPVPPNQRLRVSRRATVKIRIGALEEFRIGKPATAGVELRTYPSRSSKKASVRLGKTTVKLRQGSQVTATVRLGAKARKALQHHRKLRVSIIATGRDASGGRGGGFAPAQLSNPRRSSP